MKIGDKVRILDSFGRFPIGISGIVKKIPFQAYEKERQITIFFDLGILLEGDNRLSGWMFEEVIKGEEK